MRADQHSSTPRPSLPRVPKRRRKRTALALGVTAVGLSGASNLALSLNSISAQNQLLSASDAQKAAYQVSEPAERRSASDLHTSDAMIETLIDEEGIRYDVYRDTAGYLTVGAGHKIAPEDNLGLGDTIRHERAVDFLEQDLTKAEESARKLLGGLPVNQHEFDALVDLVFNVGEGTVSERNSPRLNAAIDASDYDAICDELNYTTAGNSVAQGLVHRSERRTQIFESANYSDPREA